MNTKHTPGPWHIGMQPGPIIYGAKGAQVADLRGERKTLVVELDEAVANTRLISAAPDLLAALEAYDLFFEKMPKGQLGGIVCDIGLLNDAFCKSRAAIAKAKGE